MTTKEGQRVGSRSREDGSSGVYVRQRTRPDFLEEKVEKSLPVVRAPGKNLNTKPEVSRPDSAIAVLLRWTAGQDIDADNKGVALPVKCCVIA